LVRLDKQPCLGTGNSRSAANKTDKEAGKVDTNNLTLTRLLPVNRLCLNTMPTSLYRAVQAVGTVGHLKVVGMGNHEGGVEEGVVVTVVTGNRKEGVVVTVGSNKAVVGINKVVVVDTNKEEEVVVINKEEVVVGMAGTTKEVAATKLQSNSRPRNQRRNQRCELTKKMGSLTQSQVFLSATVISTVP
jgi:hypothetical protein